MKDENAQPPTHVARRFVRYAVGFGVGVGVGMIPLQKQLLVLVPIQLHGALIPSAAFTMGVVAVAVQFFYDQRIARRKQESRFITCLVLVLIALVSLLYLHVYRIETIPIPAFETSISVILAPEREIGCDCEGPDDVLCVKELGIGGTVSDPDLSHLRKCWDTKGTEFAFILTYLLLMSTFGALIGFLMVWENMRSSK